MSSADSTSDPTPEQGIPRPSSEVGISAGNPDARRSVGQRIIDLYPTLPEDLVILGIAAAASAFTVKTFLDPDWLPLINNFSLPQGPINRQR